MKLKKIIQDSQIESYFGSYGSIGGGGIRRMSIGLIPASSEKITEDPISPKIWLFTHLASTS